MEALPPAAFFLFLESAVGGAVALMLVHVRQEVSRGFTLFTGWGVWLCAALALWLRFSFPPSAGGGLDPTDGLWFALERTLTIAFVALLLAFLVAYQARRTTIARRLAPVVPLVGLGAQWSASLLHASHQLGGLGAPLAVLAGSLALGSALVSLSLGHWYLVAPTLSVRPLIWLTFLCLGAVAAQVLLLPGLLVVGSGWRPLVEEQSLFFGVRVLFGLVVPLASLVLVWRTARIRSLDSATGLLYVVVTLVLVGEISARSLYFLTGVAT